MSGEATRAGLPDEGYDDWVERLDPHARSKVEQMYERNTYMTESWRSARDWAGRWKAIATRYRSMLAVHRDRDIPTIAALTAERDAILEARDEAWRLIGAYLHAEIDKDLTPADRDVLKRWLNARDAVIAAHDAFVGTATERKTLREAGENVRSAAFAVTQWWLTTPGAEMTVDDFKPLVIALIEALDAEGDILHGKA